MFTNILTMRQVLSWIPWYMRNPLQIQRLTSFPTSKLREKRSKQNAPQKADAEARAGNDGRQFHGRIKLGQNNQFDPIYHTIWSLNRRYINSRSV